MCDGLLTKIKLRTIDGISFASIWLDVWTTGHLFFGTKRATAIFGRINTIEWTTTNKNAAIKCTQHLSMLGQQWEAHYFEGKLHVSGVKRSPEMCERWMCALCSVHEITKCNECVHRDDFSCTLNILCVHDLCYWPLDRANDYWK